MTGIRKTLSELAHLVGGKVIGDGGVEIGRVASIDDAGPGDITLLAQPRYRSLLPGCKASAVIISDEIAIPASLVSRNSFLQVAQPYVAFAMILQLFAPPPLHDSRVSPHAAVDSSAIVGTEVTVFPYVYIGKGARVERGSVLYPGVYLGDGVEVGEDCVLHAQVTVREGCRLGNRVILHAGAVIGSDGFGYAGEGRERLKIPQLGIVEIGDDVEIGANTTIDRATLGRTVIGRGTKIDNLVHIAHNVVVGEYSVIVAQTGIAGSTRIGNDVILAGQVGIVDHVEVGDRARIGPQSGVPQSVPPGAVLSGAIAAAPHKEWLKVMTLLPRLPELWGAVRQLERRIAALSGKRRKGLKAHARH